MTAAKHHGDAPAFWFGFEVPYAKLALGRLILFGLLACDALLQLRHAPRYGSGFNVAQLPGLDALGPGRVGYGLGQLVDAYLFVLIACGVATRWLVPITAVIYSWLYFGSQLDSYQHHYLVAMLLVIACFVPWQRGAKTTLVTPVRTWALRLLLCQLAIVYVWAAISKLDPRWLDGTALGGQIHGSLRSLIDATIGMHAVAILVPLTELALAFVWLRPAWRVLAPLGILFHLGIVWSGLEIGLFAWLMIGLYAFVIPDGLYVWCANELVGARTSAAKLAVRATARGWIGFAIAVVAGLAFAVGCRFRGSLGLAITLTIMVLLVVAISPRRVAAVAIAHVLALGTWFAVDRSTTIARDYYKFWAGTSRRLKDPAAATAYRGLLELTPDDAAAHYNLGRLLLERDDATGIDELHAAERLDPTHARAHVAEARWLAAHGKSAEALAVARAGAAAEPGNAEAQSLVTSLSTHGP